MPMSNYEDITVILCIPYVQHLIFTVMEETPMTQSTKVQAFSVVSLFVLSLLVAVPSFAHPVNNVTFTGLVTCAHCVGNQPMHKGYTPWTWALESVKHQGDDIVLVVGDKIYKLQGNQDEILKYIADKATITGHLDGNTLAVVTIGKPGTGAWNNLGPAVKGLVAA